MKFKKSVLEPIGNTLIVGLDRIYPGSGRILAKCEFMYPFVFYISKCYL